MILRREQPEDWAAITAVHDAAFGCDRGAHSVESRLVDELRADGDAVPELSLVALHETEVIGHIVCSRGHIDGRTFLALGPLGVLPEQQGYGVGSALMHAVCSPRQKPWTNQPSSCSVIPATTGALRLRFTATAPG